MNGSNLAECNSFGNKVAKLGSMPSRDDHEPMRPMSGDPGEDGVAFVRTNAGAAVVPRSLARMTADQGDVVAEMQRAGFVIQREQRALRELVRDAREVGLSWDAIGWCVGLTGEGARKRYGEAVE